MPDQTPTKELDTEYMLEVICPWCGYVHQDSWEIDDGPHECHDCGRKLEVQTFKYTLYSTVKVNPS